MFKIYKWKLWVSFQAWQKLDEDVYIIEHNYRSRYLVTINIDGAIYQINKDEIKKIILNVIDAKSKKLPKC